jgi:hypothetical protein
MFHGTNSQIHMKWMVSDQHVNPNISLAQFDFILHRDDSYKTDYYVLQYPGVILGLRTLAQRKILNFIC